ncbi:hypothetical protein [Halonatronum saccharophilum]|uniref:hypothetical protein n=1 Tax=Halonatronum saccharophilum TaxID=150060 RepID=UPI001B7F7F60|nr:hypothetical protein [Halonatronum saccharophilum]
MLSANTESIENIKMVTVNANQNLKKEIEASIGLDYKGEVSVEFPISFDLFIIFFIISQLK